MAQITTSGITICISAYVLAYVSNRLYILTTQSNISLQSSNDNIFQIPIFMAVLLYGIFDIFLVMYLANDINVASDKLSYCLFESSWIGQPKSCIKCLLILGETVRHSQQLVILKVYPMNLETFTMVRYNVKSWNVSSIDFLPLLQIVKGAYSMFNILQTFN